jgi:hypothetical protein
MSACLYSCFGNPACKSLLSCVVLYRHVWPVWLYHIFPHYLIKGAIFGKIFVLIFSTTLTFLILRIFRGGNINVHSLYVKYPIFFSEYNDTCIFSTDFLKIPKC